MEKITTIDINYNPCQFQYEYDNLSKSPEVEFNIYSMLKDSDRFFSYTFKIIDNHLAKSEMMTNNNNEEFAKKGIPETVIEIASIILKRSIISSPINPEEGNYLVIPSHKVWLRLLEKNKNAYHDEVNNCFVLTFVNK